MCLRCSEMFTDVFRWSQMFLDFLYATLWSGLVSCQSSFVTMPRSGITFPFPVLGTSYHSSVCSMNWYYHHMKYTLQTPRSFSITDVRYSKDVLLMYSRCSLDVPRMFAEFFQDIFRMLRWVLLAWWNLMIISNESMDFNDPKELYDPNYLMIPSYLMTNWKYGLW